MKKNIFIFCLIVFTINLQSQNQNNFDKNEKIVKRDSYNRIIEDHTSNRINYSKKETENLIANYDNSTFKKGILTNKSANNFEEAKKISNCNADWKYSIMGTSIGRNSMNSYDLDKDGKTEIICSAISNNASFWYILKFDPINNNYQQIWTSDMYDAYITRIKVYDINNDGNYEIIIGFENGTFQILNCIDKSIIKEISIPSSEKINDIEFDDADNDGLKEIAVSTNNKIYIYNALDYSKEAELNYGANEFSIGNVDESSDKEIITTLGKVLVNNGTTTTVKWVFDNNSSSDYGYMLELSDIDKDGMQEIIRAKSWDYIDVYDVNTQSLKFEWNADLDIQALLLKDINNDGIDEIIYGDGQWGEVHCINSTTNTEIWKIKNPEHGVTAINIADVNNDGMLDVMWAAGWTSTGADYFYVADMATRSIEWQSMDIVGPFYAIAIDDIDKDGVKEIVTISYESKSGYESGILTIFDGVTKKIKWQTDGTFFNQVWTGIYDVKIEDIDNDGNKEIIVAAGQTYTGKIWIIDGITKTIKSSHLYSTENLSEFKVLNIDDVDGDGKKEIVVCTSSNYYIVNPENFAIKYSSETMSYAYPSNIKIDNIDHDSEKEIIICGDRISVYGGVSHQQWKSTESNYSNIDLYDINNDGKKDIVAGTYDGYIKVLNGVDMQNILSLKLSNNKIDGIIVSDLNNDSKPEYIFTSNGSVYIYSDSNQFIVTKKYGNYTGSFNSLKVADVNNDGIKDIIFGNSAFITQISNNCYQCMWFTTKTNIKNVSCSSANDGSINVIPNGNPPYTYNWNNGASNSSISNLSVGEYIYTVTDNNGCKINETISVKKSQLTASYLSSNKTCFPSNDGSAAVTITEGTAPFIYLWNTGASTSSITNLSQGLYSVTVTDSNECLIKHDFYINKDALTLNVDKNNATCFGLNNGSISLYPNGTPPYIYSWNNGQTSKDLYNLKSATYDVTVTDSHGCDFKESINITEPAEILTQTKTTPDDINTLFGEGSATINVIGGNPPYSFNWNDSFSQTTITAINLLAGEYIIEITDYKGCIKYDTATVNTTNGTLGINEVNSESHINIFPNPAPNSITIENNNPNKEITLTIFNINGQEIMQQQIKDKKTQVDISNLNSGIYFFKLITDKIVEIRKIIKE
jgi:hypothetical protein